MRWRRTGEAAITVATVVLVAGAGAAAARTGWQPRSDTITEVQGTRYSGFHVRHYDGSEAYLPTITEALTECGAYRKRLERVRCRVAVRTSYRGLGETKRAIWYAGGR